VRPGMASTGPGRPADVETERAPHKEVANLSSAAPATRRTSKARVRGHDAGVVAGRDLGDEHRELARRVQKLFSARNRVAHRGERLDNQPAKIHVATAEGRDSIPAQGVPTGNDGRSDLVE